MRRLLLVTAKDLLIVAKDRGAWVFLLLTPLVVITVTSFALAPVFEGGGSIDARLLVTDEDGGVVADALTAAFEKQEVELVPATRAESEALNQDGEDYAAALVIPAGSSERVAAGKEVQLEVYTDPADNVARPYLVGTIEGAATRIAAVETAATVAVVEVMKRDPDADAAAVAAAASAQAQAALTSPPVSVREISAGSEEDFNAFDTQAPGYAVMFMLFGVMSAAEGLLLEKESGTMARLLVAPISKSAVLGGKLLAQFTVAVLQISLLFAAGHFVFGMNLGGSLPALALMITVTAYAATAFGILLAGSVNTRRQLTAAGILAVLLMSALGGSWWPLDIVPDFMQFIGHFTINAWALDGINGLILRGEGFSDILPEAGVLLAYGSTCFLLGIGLFRLRSKF